VDFPVPPVHDVPMALRWRLERLAPEDVVKGWVAGPVVRVTTHWSGLKTTPCLKYMTHGKLKCMCEAKPLGSRVVGYMPIVTTDADRVVLLLPESTAKKTLRMPLGTPIQVSRTKNPTAPTKVKQLSQDELAITLQKKVHAAGPSDIKPYLLHLWQNAELTTHFAAEFYPSIATVHEAAKRKDDAA